MGLLVSEKVALKPVIFHKYSVGFPSDWNYGMVARRLFITSLDLLCKGILSTYLVKDEGGLEAWLFLYNDIGSEELKDVLSKRDLALVNYDGEVRLNPREDIKVFENLLNVWIRCKLSKVFKYSYEFDAWFVRWMGKGKVKKALCFTT